MEELLETPVKIGGLDYTRKSIRYYPYTKLDFNMYGIMHRLQYSLMEHDKKFRKFKKEYASYFEDSGSYVVIIHYNDGESILRLHNTKPEIKESEDFLTITNNGKCLNINLQSIKSIETLVVKDNADINKLRSEYKTLAEEFKEMM